MNAISIVLLATCVVGVVFGLPIEQGTTSWEKSGKFEGDIVLSPEQLIGKNGMIGTTYRWPNREMFYEIKRNEFTAQELTVILGAINEYNNKTCLRLFERTSQIDYVSIGSTTTGCTSPVGRVGGSQPLNLQQPGCISHGTVLHELLHALGFWHQQSSTNRDNFVTIQWANIQTSHEKDFKKYDANIVIDYGVPYDYGSIMHYGATAFSMNGEPTIVPKDPNAVIGQTSGLSPKDIQKLNTMYGC